jgi:amidophosphoribosyltransferase
VYGIDMSTRREFVARGRSEAEVAERIGADAVIYQELDDLVSSALADRPDLTQMCTACFSGDYPTGDITSEMLLAIEAERVLHGK